MEQILIYILFITLLLFTLIRKNKKQLEKAEQLKKLREKEKQDEYEQYEQEGSLESIINTFTGDIFEMSDKTVSPAPVMKNTKPATKSPFLDLELKNIGKNKKDTKKGTKKYFHSENIPENKTREQYSDEHIFSELSTIDDWRRAIIFSEIINKKHF